MTPRRILEQGQGQLHRRVHGVGAANLVAERELIDEHAIVRGELPVRDVVLDGQRQLALLDRVAEVGRGVGAGGPEVAVLQVAAHVDEQILRHRIDLARDGEQSGAIQAAADVNVGARAGVGGEACHAGREPRDLGGEARADQLIGESDLPAAELQLADREPVRHRDRLAERVLEVEVSVRKHNQPRVKTVSATSRMART